MNFEDFDDIEDIGDIEIEIEDFDDEIQKSPSSSRKKKSGRDPKPVRPGRLYVTGIVTGILLTATVLLFFDIMNWHPFSTTPAADGIYDLSKIVETYIDKHYWKSDTSDEQFANMSAKGMVAALGDPYSVFMTQEELTRTRERNNGDYAGIGAAIGVDTTTNRKYVTRVDSGSPSEKCGLMVGDEILMIDDLNAQEKTLDELVSHIRGTTGVSHVFKVFRAGTVASGSAVSGTTVSGAGNEMTAGETLTLTIVTDNIINKSVYHQMLKDNIGYLQILNYDRETPKQFRTAVEDLKKDGMKALILDVRNNGGGVLTSVTDVLNQLLPAGTLLTETRKNEKDQIYKSTDDEHLDLPMTVLINGYSASAAEVFAGALQDRKKVPLIGETSYGKGVVQSIFPLSGNRGGIKLTTGEYLLPSGRSINGTGLTPDEEVVFTGTAEDYGTNNDNQLIRALELMQEQIK
ncbi:MAG: S41 family peptidase [Eubacterium sp.]|nr:S41 family peptidase [Eubacterium sp.]